MCVRACVGVADVHMQVRVYVCVVERGGDRPWNKNDAGEIDGWMDG